MLCGFAHELNTPLGIVTLAISSLEDQVSQLQGSANTQDRNNALFGKELSKLHEAIELSKDNIHKMDGLITRFKKMDTTSQYHSNHTIYLPDFIEDMKQACTSLLSNHTLEVDVQDTEIKGSAVGLFQVLYQLIENSVLHGFSDKAKGLIHLDIKTLDDKVFINYQDDGCGVPKAESDNIFEPFYSTKRAGASVGLGLNVVKNIVTQSFSGTINIVPSPIGARFELVLN